jgi:UDP-galactopyranose mutase
LCFSHLRWDFVYQRPNHLMARAARDRRVFFFEEPTFDEGGAAGLDLAEREGVTVVTPRLPSTESDHPQESLRRLVDDLVRLADIKDPVLWYYTPMALEWSDHLARSLTVFDCMDHLAGFKGAPQGLVAQEGRLLDRADLVLTGGAQLYAAKRRGHTNVHCFPSSVDVNHFRRARRGLIDPADQAAIPHPRFGYCGVIDERLDLDLVAATAASRLDWQFVMIGPVVKVDPASLPQGVNIHYLGMKRYEELPAYLGGWDVGIMPFAHNDATRYISPTKTAEYLAAGLRVASTSIHDVVEPYGRTGLAQIGDGGAGFLEACTQALATDVVEHRHSADTFLAENSWDRTWASIDTLIATALERRSRNRRTTLVAAARPAVLGARTIPAGAATSGAAPAMRSSSAPRRSPATAGRTNGKPATARRTTGKPPTSTAQSIPAAATPLARQRPASPNAGTLARIE